MPHGGKASINDYIPAGLWWEEPVIKLHEHGNLTRKQIVLAAANTDGGAHVDKKLTAYYKRLASEGGLGVNT